MRVPAWYEDKSNPAYRTVKAWVLRVFWRFPGLLTGIALLVIIAFLLWH